MLKHAEKPKFEASESVADATVFCQECGGAMIHGNATRCFIITAGETQKSIIVDGLRTLHCTRCEFEIESPDHIMANAGWLMRAFKETS